MNEREQLEHAIATLEAQRAILGDAVVDAALGPMRGKLAALQAQEQALPVEQRRKQVTVLFADVSGFTAMSETMDAEEVSTTMNYLWQQLDTVIVSHGGKIDKHIGDAVMALWGVEAAREDDPERAIRAALNMQKELTDFGALVGELKTGAMSESTFGSLQSPIAIRIGINTGPVLLGVVGTTGEFTAMGDTVNLASRLEHAAPVGAILVSHDTYRHVRGVFDVQTLEPIQVKGKSEPVQVYVVQRVKPRAFRNPARGVEGIETRTIGREAELQRMQEALYTTLDERKTHLVSIVAEAGTGKSRLLYEFTNWFELLPERTLLFKGRATQEMANLPYALVRDVFASRFEIQDSDRASVVRDKLERGLLNLMGIAGEEAAMRAHFIGHLIGFDFSGSPHLQGILSDARQIRDRAFHYAAEFFTEVARHQLIVVMLEDIHWADDGSLDLMEHVMRARPALPLLVISPTRPTLFEQRPTWGAGPMQHIRLDLQPLTQEFCHQLVAEILRKAPEVPSELQNLIVSRAEGSPFYVEELIKVLIDDGVILTGDERWRVEIGRLAQVRIPATLTGLIQARLDSLPYLERETLQQASVVGRVFWNRVLEHMHNPEVERGEPIAPAAERLGALTKKEFVFWRGGSAFANAQEYIFRHTLLREATYESILKRLRRVYHAQVAESLIELAGERAGEYAGRIGEHYEQANDWVRAAEWYGRAGKQAQDTYAPEAAIEYYQKALSFWEKSAGLHKVRAAQKLEVYRGLGEVLKDQARYEEALQVYTTMRLVAEAAGEVAFQATAWCGLSLAQDNLGDHRAALESATQAEEIARTANARLELAKALWMKGRCLYRLGNAEAALGLGEQVLALTTELDNRPEMARGLNLLGVVHGISGRYEQAQRDFERALAVCQQLGDRKQEESLLNNLGVIADFRGDYRAAFDRFEQALNIARQIGNRDGELMFLTNLGAARVGLGEHSAAESDLRQVVQMTDTPAVLANTYYLLSEACLGQHKLAEALEAARQGLALGRSAEQPEYVAPAWRALGQVLAHPDYRAHIPDFRLAEAFPDLQPELEKQKSEAVACFAESLRICTEIGMEGERARTLRAWGKYELEWGDRERGAPMWQEARDLFAQLGADLEVERMKALPAPKQK